MSDPPNSAQLLNLLALADSHSSPEERAAFLNAVPDAALRSRVHSLLELQDAERTQTIQFGPATAGSPKPEVRFEGTARFEPLSVLGTGGFGTVYRVFDRERNTAAALKILREKDAQVLYRFKQEFRTLANLRHPNLIRLYDLFGGQDQWFFTMELVEGVPFYQHSRGDLPALRRALPQLIRALDHLHSQGLLHLDIKPPNVFVTAEGRVVLLDFGLVRDIYGAGPQSVTLCGTPEFMAPEQVERRTPMPAADWYAVGVMLYQVLTDQLPFSGNTVEIFTAKLAGPPPPLASLRDNLPPDLVRLCEELLDQDPQRRPGTVAILKRLGESAPPEAAQLDSFVGRTAQLAAMRDAWVRVERGRTVVLNVSGKSGFGKSTLVREFLDWVTRNHTNALILTGRCRENESVPFKALDEIVDALTQRIVALPAPDSGALTPPGIDLAARLFPVLGELCGSDEPTSTATGDFVEIRRRAFAIVIDLLLRVSARAILVVAIDDLQWGDADSAIFLRELLSAQRPPSMLLISSFRSEDAESSEVLRFYRSALGERDPAVDVEPIEVGAFDSNESAEYASRLLGAHDVPERRRLIVEEAAGSPLLIAQLARYAEPGGSSSGLGLQAMIEKHLGELPRTARELLEAVALADQPLSQSIVQRAAGIETDDFSGVWTLISDRLVRTREHVGHRELECYHDKIREAVVSSLAPDRRREWHRRLATAIEQAGGAEPALLATHFADAGDSPKATHYARLAADAAHFALAFDRAAAFDQLTLDHGELSPEERRTIFRRMAIALACAGRGDRAADAYTQAAEGAPPSEASNLLRLAAEQYLLDGRIEDGMQLLNRVVRSAGMWIPANKFGVLCSLIYHRLRISWRGLSYVERDAASIPPRTLQAIDVCQTASHALAPIDGLRAAEFHTRALLRGLRAGEPHRVAMVLGRESMDLAARGARFGRQSQAVMAMAQSLTDRLGEQRLQAQQAAFNGTRALFTGHWREAADELDRALRIRTPDDPENAWMSSVIGGLYFTTMPYTGEIRLLREQLPTRLRAFDRRRAPFGLANLKLRAEHLTWLASDNPQRARHELGVDLDNWPTDPYLCQRYFALAAITETDLYEAAAHPGSGLEFRAYDRFDEEWTRLRRSWLYRLELTNIEGRYFKARTALVVAFISPKRRSRLLAEVEKDAERMIRPRADWGLSLAAILRAGAAAIRGDHERALLELAVAERGLITSQMPLHLAAVRRQRGLLIGGEEGRTRIAAADEWMTGETIRNPECMAHTIAPGFQQLQAAKRATH